MDIRTAGIEEFDQIIQFYYDLIDSMRDVQFRPEWEKGVYPTEQFIKNSLLKRELHIAADDGHIIGAAVINHEHAKEYDTVNWNVPADDSSTLIIHILAVAFNHQGQGIAKKIVAYAAEFARAEGMKAVRLDVLAGNRPAHKLYLTMGFTYVCTKQIFYEDTGWKDFLLYELVL